ELSPVEATQNALQAIEEHDGEYNAFCLVDADRALEQAKAAEIRWRDGHPIGWLDGVPASIKDIFLTQGWPTLRGSKAIAKDQPWDVDSPAAARMRGAGMVLLGKTTTPEIGWKGVTDSPLTGITRNPADPAKTAGGSSGGSGAAVAAGMGELSVGTDGGGSVRIPAAFCGIVGAAVGSLADAGLNVEQADPGFDDPKVAFDILWSAGAAKMLDGLPPGSEEIVDAGLRKVWTLGRTWSASQYLDANAVRAALG